MTAARSPFGTRTGAALILLLSMVACTGPASAPSASTAAGASASGELPAGWKRVEVAAEGFSIAIPDGWDDLSEAEVGESGNFEELESANPGVADAFAQAQAAMESGQIAFFALDREPDDPEATFVANVNVIDAGPATESAAEAAEQMAGGIRAQIPVNGDIEIEGASLPSGEAAILRYEWTVTGADGAPIDLAVTQYAVVSDGTGYILTFTATAETLAGYAPIFEQMAASFRLP